MIELKDYTLIIYKKDARYKAGEVRYNQYEYKDKHQQWMAEEIRDLQVGLYPVDTFRLELHETWVTKRNAMTGEEYQERFDTPYSCSPSSEAYWCN